MLILLNVSELKFIRACRNGDLDTVKLIIENTKNIRVLSNTFDPSEPGTTLDKLYNEAERISDLINTSDNNR